MSGGFYSNIDEFKEGISLLKYMGFIKNTFSLSMKIVFNKPVFLTRLIYQSVPFTMAKTAFKLS
jgi:hypothetical protein